MPQSLANLLVHLVYSTKNRERVLTDAIRDELHRYTAGILKGWESPAVLINSVEDHVHVLFHLSRKHGVAKIVEELKTSSSKWIKTKSPAFASFHWQNGYGAFSVSQSNVPAVREYIENQAEHHRQKTFEQEYREFLQRHEIEFDERYVWD
jgi:REP element-mobilizing transposase RayT